MLALPDQKTSKLQPQYNRERWDSFSLWSFGSDRFFYRAFYKVLGKVNTDACCSFRMLTGSCDL
jgi:hypothetical protein